MARPATIRKKSFRLLVKEVAEYIGNYVTQNGYMPYNKEIKKFLGRDSPHLSLAKAVLVEKGVLTKVRRGYYKWNPGVVLDIETIEPPADNRTVYEILAHWIPCYVKKNGVSPTASEMAQAARCDNKTLSYTLTKMVREGLMKKTGWGEYEWANAENIPSDHRAELKKAYRGLISTCQNFYIRYRRFPFISELATLLKTSNTSVTYAIEHAVSKGELVKDSKGHVSLPQLKPPPVVYPTEQEWGELDEREAFVLKAIYAFYEQKTQFPAPKELSDIIGIHLKAVYETYESLLMKGHITLNKIPKAGYRRKDFFFAPYTGGKVDVCVRIVEAILEYVADHQYYPPIDSLLRRLDYLNKHEVMTCIGHLSKTGVLRWVNMRHTRPFIQLLDQSGSPAWTPNLGRANLRKQGPQGRRLYQWAWERYNTQGLPFTNAQACQELNEKRSLTASSLGILKGYGLVRKSGYYLLPTIPQEKEYTPPDIALFDNKRLREFFNVSSSTSERIMKRIGRKVGRFYVAPREDVIRYGLEYGYL